MPENSLIVFQIFALPVSQYIMSVVAAVGSQRKTKAFALTSRTWPVFRSGNILKA